ncbi:Hypothetical predicted protein, partial [Podarcis lilfordi]
VSLRKQKGFIQEGFPMGQSLFLENRGQRLVQVWLLTFCVLLCFRTGADAVNCRKCRSLSPGKPCEPKGKTCEGPFCIMAETYGQSGEVITYVKECGAKSWKEFCGKEMPGKVKKTVACCHTDLCFD